MAKEFDATLKGMLECSPADWPRVAGRAAPDATVIDADISTVSGAADKVVKVQGSPDWIFHAEFQAGPDASVPQRLNVYNSLLEARHDLRVRSAVFLLRPEANLTAIDGVYRCQFEDDPEPYRVFRYDPIRVWTLPVETLLGGGIGTLPLAPLSNVTRRDLPDVVGRMKQRLDREVPEPLRRQLWSSAYILMGLRYDRAMVSQLLQGVLGMKESSTYQAIIEEGRAEGLAAGRLEGRVEEARELLLKAGRSRFKVEPPAKVRRRVEGIQDRAVLEELLIQQLSAANSWEELLSATPKRPRRKTS